MAFRIALFAVPALVALGAVVLLNVFDAGAGVATATLGLVALAGGAGFGVFADRLPEFPRVRRGGGSTHPLAGTHHNRH